MSSNINYSPIDQLYPISGRNNSTQGFRDNFSYIKTALQTASGEITSLQNAVSNLQNSGSNSSAITVDQYGNVGIGTTTPSTTLTVAGAGGSQKRAVSVSSGNSSSSAGGIYLSAATSTGSNGAAFEAIGLRNDNNVSANYSGNVLLGHLQTNAAITTSGIALGRVGFGGNAVGNALTNIRYSAQIVGITDGIWSSNTVMPTALSFYTGSSGIDVNSSLSDFGTERMRINSSGNVGIGTQSPGQKLSVVGTIESTTGGFKFPDGTTQTTAYGGSNVSATGGILAAGTYSGSYTDGAVVDYVTGNGRISVGTADTLSFYTGGIGTTIMAQITSTGINSTAIGATTASTGRFSTLSATGVFTASAGTAALPSIVTASGSTSGLYSSTANVLGVSISATSIGTFTSTGLNGMNIGATTRGTGAFTTLGANAAVTIATTTNNQSYTTTGAGTITISSGTAGSIDNMNIGATTAGTGTFTTLSATTRATGSVIAATGGLTAVTAVTGSLTLATGGVTLASQAMAAGSVWRVRAYGTYNNASTSANARQFTMACYWGTTALTAITTGNVSTTGGATYLTNWEVEFTITGSSATAAWVTGRLFSGVTAANTASPLLTNATAASTGTLTTTSTLDFRVGQTGTATSTDVINVQSVIMERIK